MVLFEWTKLKKKTTAAFIDSITAW
jgi:hypothetical protein